jgi:hypothetical protein
MRQIAKFEFVGTEALGSREDITHQGVSDVSIRAFRQMRTTPLSGMKQPLLNSAIMGMETVLEVYHYGKPAIGYYWKLYRVGKKAKLVQRGKIDHNGVSGDVAVKLRLIGKPELYQLVVFEPAKKKPRSGSLAALL